MNCTIAISTTQEASQQDNCMIDAVYEDCVSFLVVVQCFVMPHAKHVYVLLPLIIPPVSHMHLGLCMEVGLKGGTTNI